MKINSTIRDTLGFGDVLIQPGETQLKPSEVQTKTRLTKTLELGIPVIAAGHAQVTESAMAIAIARLGGLGIIHDNMPLGKQVEEVRRVKRAQGKIVRNPIVISPDSSTAEAMDLMTTYKISGLPVVDDATKQVVGIITGRDLRYFEDYAKPVRELMTQKVITVRPNTDIETIKRLMHENRIEKLVITGEDGKCVGLITNGDIQKTEKYIAAAVDAHGSLLVGAAVTLGKDAVDRASAMADAGLDAVFVDVAHAHSKDAVTTVSRIRQQRSTEVQVIAGNVATAAAARSLIDAGADAIKVGIGGCAGAATRTAAGIGVPHLTALLEVVDVCSMTNTPVILDGGVCGPSSFAKAIAAGAQAVVFTDPFLHTDEAPAAPAKAAGADPFRVEDGEGLSIHRGSVAHAATDFVNGLKLAMAYAGGKDIKSFQEGAIFVRAG